MVICFLENLYTSLDSVARYYAEGCLAICVVFSRQHIDGPAVGGDLKETLLSLNM
jgi:hypothetical protein